MAETTIDWTYDRLNRLVEEDYVRTGTGAGGYIHQFTYDLVGNRLTKTIDTDRDDEADQTIAYSYDNPNVSGTAADRNDRLWGETSTGAEEYVIAYNYDANGSMIVKDRTGVGAAESSFVWDLRNRMTAATVDSTTTLYGYDSDGQRVSTKTGTDPTTDLHTDKNNPTGYPQIIEEKTGTTSPTTLDRSYVIGMRVEAQADTTTGTHSFVRDGHGSNRASIVLDTGAVAETYDYHAFGEALGFDPLQALTVQLFGGDAEYDTATGWYYHDARWRDGFRFTSFDSFEADPSSPADLHKYVAFNGDPANGTDPTGMFADFTLGGQLLIAGFQAWLIGIGLQRIGYGQTDWGFLDPFRNPVPLAVSLIPVFGSLVEAAHFARQGQQGLALLNVGFAVLDLLPVGAVLGRAGKVAARAVPEGVTEVVEQVANRAKRWVWTGTEEAAQRTQDVFDRLMRDYAGDWEFPLADPVTPRGLARGTYNVKMNVIALGPSANYGTILEELIHHDQAKRWGLIGHGFNPADEAKIEEFAASHMRALGFVRD